MRKEEEEEEEEEKGGFIDSDAAVECGELRRVSVCVCVNKKGGKQCGATVVGCSAVRCQPGISCYRVSSRAASLKAGPSSVAISPLLPSTARQRRRLHPQRQHLDLLPSLRRKGWVNGWPSGWVGWSRFGTGRNETERVGLFY